MQVHLQQTDCPQVGHSPAHLSSHPFLSGFQMPLPCGLLTIHPLLRPFVLQDLLEDSHAHGTDASGNPILKDIGMFMRSELKSYFKDGDIKYIDPSYIIR
jgi:hypothetical protein